MRMLAAWFFILGLMPLWLPIALVFLAWRIAEANVLLFEAWLDA